MSDALESAQQYEYRVMMIHSASKHLSETHRVDTYEEAVAAVDNQMAYDAAHQPGAWSCVIERRPVGEWELAS